ncbi:MAG: hypothetical protein Q9210_003332 [Variospora velana]
MIESLYRGSCYFGPSGVGVWAIMKSCRSQLLTIITKEEEILTLIGQCQSHNKNQIPPFGETFPDPGSQAMIDQTFCWKLVKGSSAARSLYPGNTVEV